MSITLICMYGSIYEQKTLKKQNNHYTKEWKHCKIYLYGLSLKKQ